MTDAGQSYALDLSDAERILTEYLATLAAWRPATRSRHGKILRRFLAALAEARGVAGRLLLDESQVVHWMIRDAQGGSAGLARVRLMIVSRYVRALWQWGLLPADPVAQFRARHGNRRWAVLVRALQATDPEAALTALEVTPVVPTPLTAQVWSYLEFHQSLGRQYAAHRSTLTALDNFLRAQQTPSLAAISPVVIEQWLASLTCSAAARLQKARRVRRFFAHLLGLGLVGSNPVSRLLVTSRSPPPLRRPFIFTTGQVSAILAVARAPQPGRFAPWHAQTCYTMIVLLYALGLRHAEVRRLRIRDLDLARQTLFIEQSKFHKSRCLPFGPKVARCLQDFLDVRRTLLPPLQEEDPLFVTWWRAPVGDHLLGDAFRAIMRQLGLVGSSGHRPRLHDLRHTFAVHRLLRWYRQGVDVQSRLPWLATFLGHVELRSTEVYLTITEDLLREASERFHRHFGGAVPEGRRV